PPPVRPYLAGAPCAARSGRRDVVGEPRGLHRAGGRSRYGRPGGAVPPPVWQQRQGRLTTSGRLRAPAISTCSGGLPTLSVVRHYPPEGGQLSGGDAGRPQGGIPSVHALGGVYVA